MKYLVLTFVLLTSCAGLWSSLKGAAAPAGGAAAGAAAGSLAGPAGTIGGAAIGAALGHGIAENAALRSGELQGDGARDKEQARWKGLTAQEWEGRAYDAASGWGSLWTRVKWIAAGVLAWVLWRNRHNYADLGFLRGLWHGLVGGEKKFARALKARKA